MQTTEDVAAGLQQPKADLGCTVVERATAFGTLVAALLDEILAEKCEGR